MSGNHNHKGPNRKNLLIATLLNLVISVVELIGGTMSGSLALFSDALHNLGDAFSTFMAYVANVIAGKKSTPKRTFGYRRIEILAALLNSVLLIGITLFLFSEAIERLKNPQKINSILMLIVAAIGLIANLIAVILLHRDAGHNLNVKAAYLHLIGDSLSSVVVIAGGLFIYFFDVYWIDPVITFVIGVYIFYEALKILNEAIRILMQNVPANLNIQEVKTVVEKNPRVRNIHHIHAWSLTDQKIYFEAHVESLEDMNLSDAGGLRDDISKVLKEQFNIDHITLQIEYRVCGDEIINNEH